MVNARRIRITLVTVIVGACAVILLTSCQRDLTSQALRIDHDSPQMLLASYERSVSSRAYTAIANAVVPGIRDEMEAMLSAYKHYRAWEGRTKRAIRKRFGKRLSDKFSQSISNMVESMFNGVLLWNAPPGAGIESVRIDVMEHVAKVMDPSGNVLFGLEQSDGQWYVGFDDNHKRDIDNYRRLVEALATRLKFICQGIKNGRVNDDNVINVLSFSQKPPGMPSIREIERETIVE